MPRLEFEDGFDILGLIAIDDYGCDTWALVSKMKLEISRTQFSRIYAQFFHFIFCVALSKMHHQICCYESKLELITSHEIFYL